MNNSIIMADNNLEFSTAVANLMRKKNLKIKTIDNGVSAADQLNEEFGKGQRLPSVLIVDLSLPELDGIELLSTLAKEGNLCTVVAISSDFEYYDLKSFLRTPLIGVLRKTEPEAFVHELLKLTAINKPEQFNAENVTVIEPELDRHQARQ